MMKSWFNILTLILLTALYVFASSNTILKVEQLNESELNIFVDEWTHIDYGLAYPLTYQISIPPGSNNLQAYARKGKNLDWTKLESKTSDDFFNGIDAVRFEYNQNTAFVSVAFGDASDSISIQIRNQLDIPVPILYQKITKYYDNRDAVVISTADDWADYCHNKFVQSCIEFRKRKLWLSTAIITSWWSDFTWWNDIQTQLDSGYVEAIAHSRNHPHTPYIDNYSEVAGCKTDIMNRLVLPDQFRYKDNEYVYVWVAPFGNYDDDVDEVVSQSKYLVSRMYTMDYHTLPTWDSEKQKFEPIGVSLEIGPTEIFGSPWPGTDNIDVLNSTFDSVTTASGVYHAMIHPNTDVYLYDYFHQHLDYISGRKNIWYAATGHLYLYHFLQENPTSFIPTPEIISAKPSSSLSGAVELNVINDRYSKGYWIYYQSMGTSLKDSVLVEDGNYTINNLSEDSLYKFTMKAVRADGAHSHISNSAISSPRNSLNQLLIIDGANSNLSSRHGTLLHDMDYGIASCGNIAIENNSINLNDFKIIDYLAGNGNNNNITKSFQEIIKAYLENGGNLLISGSNLGSNLSSNGNTSDKSFYQAYFKSVYLYPGPDNIESQFYQLEPLPGSIFEGLPILQFDDGTHGTYDVYSPDVIAGWKGGKDGLIFSGAKKLYKGACTYYSGTFGESSAAGKVVNLSIPVESIYPEDNRKQLLQRIINFFNDSTSTSVNLVTDNLPHKIELMQNYPNPFNPSTTLEFTLPKSEYVDLKIYNVLGKEVSTLVSNKLNQGNHLYNFDGSNLASGIYYYQLVAGEYREVKKMILIR